MGNRSLKKFIKKQWKVTMKNYVQNCRKRNLQDVPNDLDDLMKDHQQSQEQVAEEMLSLTKTLKEQSIAAKEVIQKDTKKIEKANEVVDKNSEKLKKEDERF